jgi:hypothetical protein
MVAAMQSTGEVLAEFRLRNGIPLDEAMQASWVCQLGPVPLRLPNFRWRRRAIDAHDLHHLVTGYPCTLRGEFQMAAWEFGAGRMPHWGAQVFCLPLVVIGLAWSPRRIWSSFSAGRHARSLHGIGIDRRLLRSPWDTVRDLAAGQLPKEPGLQTGLRFIAIVVEALVLLATPGIAALTLAWGLS